MPTRKQIRSAISTAIAPVFERTFDYRPADLDPDDLPCAAVYFQAGDTEKDFDEEYRADSQLVIEIWAASMRDIDGALDEKEEAMKPLIAADTTFGDLIAGITRNGFSYDRDPETSSGSLAITYTVYYEEE